MERRAASAGVGAPRRARNHHAPPPIRISNAAIAAASGASAERFFGAGGLHCRRGLRLCGDADSQRIDPYRLGDVLELGLAEIGNREIEPALDLAIGVLGETDAARLAMPSSRAAILTPSPIRSPSLSSTTSPR